MKTLINLLWMGALIMLLFDPVTYYRLEAPLIHVIQYALVIYVLWIVFSDFFKTLKRSLVEKFGFTMKRFKRKIKHMNLKK
jgi:hypothetical protein